MKKILLRSLSVALAVVVALCAAPAAFASPEADVAGAPAMPVPMPAATGESRDGAAGSPEGGMETALIAIKSLVDIDDEAYPDFSYSSSSSSSEVLGGLIWSFYWSDAKNAFIYATVSSGGMVMQYRKYVGDERSFGFAEISKAEATAIADGFIQRVKPESCSYYRTPMSVSININSSEYGLNYYADVNGYTFHAAQIHIDVNKFTGEIMSYSASNLDPGRYSFEGVAGVIGESEAVAAYAEKIGLRLEYRSYFDYENSSVTVFPVYQLDADWNTYISATTGEVVEYVFDVGEDYGGYSGGAPAPSAAPEMAADSAAGNSRASLSPAEIQALDRVSGFMTSEQALQKLLETADLPDLDVAAFSERNISLNRDYMDRERYVYDVMLYRYDEAQMRESDLMYLYGRVNAETGKVYSFSLNYPRVSHYGEESAYTQEQAEANIAAFLERVAPDELAKCEKDDIDYGYRDQSVNVRYTRYENGIPYSSNGVYATFDPYFGRITNFSLNWHENASFPPIDDVLPQGEALEAFIKQVGIEVSYITTGGGYASLVYEPGSRGYIDPFTGNAIEYNGKPASDSAAVPEYGDVAGHWSEAVVTKLLDNGVFLWGGGFEPDSVMTELEFLRYILLVDSYYMPIEPASYLAMRGINIEVDASKTLTRQEAARIIIEYLGYGKLAEQSEWFVYPFRDGVDEAAKAGVTAIIQPGGSIRDQEVIDAANEHKMAMVFTGCRVFRH
ncbi:MAG: hypothetical protein FWG19_01775 [Methanomassiliicoccaceae archaeon]|nr:hypothetical protein [Methanomassiliicoccaceae archaeon]